MNENEKQKMYENKKKVKPLNFLLFTAKHKIPKKTMSHILKIK